MVKAVMEFCGRHLVEKLNAKRKKYLRTEYGENQDVTLWVDKMYAIRYDPPELMKKIVDDLKMEAQTKFNVGKKGRFTKSSLFRRYLSFWDFVVNNYIDGKYATCEG